MTFCVASTFLQELYDDVTRQFLRRTGIKWIFQTPRSPWKGEFFEQLIGVVKWTLATTLRCKMFNKKQLQTFMKEAEAVVNNNPLMYTGDMHEDEALTPSHLIRNVIHLLLSVVPHEDMHQTLTTTQLHHQYFRLTETLDHFKCYSREGYLRSLQEWHDL
ncbi:uncharacterized protein LOC135218085 [Macrobrachium nipponense]|uniref:uncharacterized protein LOC135218085 n=1 Tax=Macrobrachium nipponense TaxID=159736 RepID=UPI0030C8C077